MAILFEIHYYDGGLKTELVPAGPRPDLLPEPLGPQSTEVELHEGEFAVELLCSNRKNHKIVWIGLYTFGVDRQHGARGNYCGVGVWLIDVVPIYVDHILSDLSTLASRISQDRGPSREVLASLESAANKSDELGWGVTFDRWPPALSSAAFSPVDDGSSVYITGRQGDKFDFKLVAADILRQFTQKPKAGEARSQRRLYLMRRSSKLPGSTLAELDYPTLLTAGEQAIFEFCEATAEPMARQNALIENQRRAAEDHAIALAAARGDLTTETQRGDRLQAALNASEEQRSAMQETFAAVRRFTADGGGAGGENFSTRLEQIHHIVSDSQARLGDIERFVSGRTRRPAPPDEDGEEIGTRRGRDDPEPARWWHISGLARRWRRKSTGTKLRILTLVVITLAALAGFGLWYFGPRLAPGSRSGGTPVGHSMPLSAPRPRSALMDEAHCAEADCGN